MTDTPPTRLPHSHGRNDPFDDLSLPHIAPQERPQTPQMPRSSLPSQQQRPVPQQPGRPTGGTVRTTAPDAVDPALLDEARTIRALHNVHGVEREMIAQCKKYGLSLSDILRRLDSGTPLLDIEEELAAYEDADHAAVGKPAPQRQRDQQVAEEARMRQRVAVHQDVIARQSRVKDLRKGQYIKLTTDELYSHFMNIGTNGSILALVMLLLLVDWYFSVEMLEMTGIFPMSGRPFAITSQNLFEMFSRWLIVVPILSTIGQANYFPLTVAKKAPFVRIKKNMSLPEKLWGGGTLLVNWGTSLAGIALVLWSSWIGAIAPAGIPIGKFLIIPILTPILAFCLSAGPEWMFRHFLPLFISNIWSLFREIHHNIWTFFVIEEPRTIAKTLLVNSVFFLSLYCWLLFVPGRWIMPQHGLTWNAVLWLYGLGGVVSLFFALIAAMLLTDKPARAKSQKREMNAQTRTNR